MQFLSFCLFLLIAFCQTAHAEQGWISLFNGKDLAGWKVNENPETFRVEEGILVAQGKRSHLFYEGEVAGADFKNFHWRCEVMLAPHANSGMYFHTAYQAEGWPDKGYEAQLNNTQGDPKKTGGLYDIADVLNHSPAKDNEWFTQEVIVRDKRIVVKVNGVITTDYQEPEDASSDPERRAGRVLSSGTFALQGHDPDSLVKFRKIEVKLLD